MKKMISWESQHLEFETKTGRLKVAEELPQNQTAEGVQAKYCDDDDDDSDGEGYQLVSEIQEVMSTPFGLWKVDDTMNPLKQFKLWMGHTNFSITQSIVNTIKSIDGVEVLYILTRYRFIVGVGALFDFHDVRLEIEKQICGQTSIPSEVLRLIDNSNIQKQVEELKSKLEPYEKWAIYVFPNGNVDYTSYDSKGLSETTQKEFEEKLEIYKQSVQVSHGVLIESGG